MSAGGGVQRVLLLIIPMFLLALQLLVGLRLPRADHAGSPGAFKDGVAFTVISIEPERRSARQTGSLDFLRDETGASRGYEDENEMPIGDRVNCSRVLLPGESQASQAPGALWLLCVEGWSLPSQGPPCVAYSFSMDEGDTGFLEALSKACDVHRFDPSGQHGDRASSGYRDDGFGGFRQYRAWLDWRTARGRKQKKKKGVLCSGSRTLKDIMETLGHHTVDFLYADLLSAEWRVLQNWAELGTLGRIRHLVATVHLQWAGFEVGGTEAEVVRYWFSVLQGLQDAGFRLVHSSPGAGKSVLRHQVDNAHSSYTLSWVNTGPIH
ncbi:probable methyltransferase-like protein 24 isoform X3 [Salmo salar]|uniref:Probable methyltransferase-like protein 24 isoform X3 n=1 Tax=Salmo salar TaxID=8030 RepID=A0A1S3Q114_SALSA|nr:probable methyltransferase-like protein 24 isoform X3 [Salmo salar]|eukprot:XP_014033650.1 PREDICTED: methyltransferase-like protein 24 isoform X3 [Salmo salar]